jgi:hypothetical protein
LKVNKSAVTLLLLVGELCMSHALQAQNATRVYGVTVTDPWNPGPVVTSLSALAFRPTARIVFDEWVRARKYRDLVAQIGTAAFVMGELLDSAYVKQYSVTQYRQRTDEYLSTLGSLVNIWEICNECNGEWLGRTADVVAKMTYAYDATKARGYPAALTLYYNDGCWSKSANEMFRWTEQNVPARMRQDLDYVLVSYYEDDCEGVQPYWPSVFDRLGALFPNSKIGFGEVGTLHVNLKEEYIQRYYTLPIAHPRYIGGHFWWYFNEDMVPHTKPLWRVLNAAFQ